jgi:hypothetical protein
MQTKRTVLLHISISLTPMTPSVKRQNEQSDKSYTITLPTEKVFDH